MTVTVLNRETAYAHPDFDGVALRFVRYSTTDPDVEYHLVCEDDWCNHQTEACYAAEDVEPEEDQAWAYVVMIGDDAEHLVETFYLRPLAAGSYDPECGQTGCMHNRS